MKNKAICVICGGNGSEREISLRTGNAVFKSLTDNGYTNVTLLDLDFGDMEAILEHQPDVCFNALHGTVGEDGQLQEFLESYGIRYTGTGSSASAVAFDKHLTKLCLEMNKIPTAGFVLVSNGKAEPKRYPCVVKPAREGSTVGISIVKDEKELDAAVKLAEKYDNKVLVEDFIKGKELTVSILNGEVMPPIWIRPKSGFYDYNSKYTAGATEYIFDLEMTEEDTKKLKELALQVYDVVGCKGASRVDFIFGEDKVPYVLEINTAPGMTETSLLPKACAKNGISFIALIEKMLDEGLKKWTYPL